MRIIFATGNKDKMREVRDIMADTGYEVVSMEEAGIDVQAEENGRSFEQNALIKARSVWGVCRDADGKASGDMVLADDSGLEVDYLHREPGIYSARYMGRDTSYRIKNHNIITRLRGVPEEKRTARFVCAVAAVFPDGSEQCGRETLEGPIAYEESGENGFGYDPIFYLPEYKMTSAQLPPDVKNSISHRGKALRHMKDIIRGKTNEKDPDSK